MLTHFTANPETISTDYDEADRLYFENITLEVVLDIVELESPTGVIVSVGGQLPNNIAFDLHRQSVPILGTSPEMIHNAENRWSFSRKLDTIHVDQPEWKNLTSIEDATKFCKGKYPVLVRPSYVLSGAAMNTVYSEKDLSNYLKQASAVSRDHPVVITKYIEDAKEIEMDAVALNGKMVAHFISEHVENAGVHSGDATLILPPQDLEPETVRRIETATRKIGNAFNVTGPFNIQFIAKDNDIKVIECNIRASRSFPFVSKTMGVDLIEMATKAMAGIPLKEYPPVNIPPDFVGVKVPQFSFSRLSGADPVLGVEMASTGEVACFGRDKYEAYIKALISTGFRLPRKNILLSIGSHQHKVEMLPSVERLHQIGFNLFATPGTADYLQEHGIPVKYLEVLGISDDDQASEYSLSHHLSQNLIDLYINLPSANRFRRPANYMSKGYRTRRMAVDYQIPLVTNVKNAKILIEAIARHYNLEITKNDFQTSVDEDTPMTSSTVLPAPQALFSHSVQDSLTNSPLKGKHVISVNQFTKKDLHLLLTVASDMRIAVQRHGVLEQLKGRLLCTMFYEASTRTSASFDAAMQRLGGRVVPISVSQSSTTKGESLADSIRTLACYSDAIVLRHPDDASADIAAKYSPVPVINAGNGTREHPTQAILDLFTIREELGTVNGLNITFVGDLKNGRTVHSLCALLAHYSSSITLVAPKHLAIPPAVRQALHARGQLAHETTELTEDIIARTDVLYVTRVQKERFTAAQSSEHEANGTAVTTNGTESPSTPYVISNRTLRPAKKAMVVMHPLPRNEEIAEEVDTDPRAAYFRQMNYGLYVRMALLALVLAPM